MPTGCCSLDDRGSPWTICAPSRAVSISTRTQPEAALRERRYRDRVSADVAGADQAGVHGTPTFFIGEERLEGSWTRLAELVPAMLAK